MSWRGSGHALLSLGIAVQLMCLTTIASAAAPIKEIPTEHIGWEVEGLNTSCLFFSGHQCQPAKESGEGGGFSAPEEAVSAGKEVIYVADTNNNRIEELSSSGAFILTFGYEVNETKVHTVGASLSEKDVCTAASHDKCQAATGGGAAGQLGRPRGLAVDTNGDLYVEERQNERVQKFTPAGQFVLMIGQDVDQTKDETAGSTVEERNLCTASSKDVCKAGVQRKTGNNDIGSFAFSLGYTEQLAVGVAGDILYVADEHRVQKFHEDGSPDGEIRGSLEAISTAEGSEVASLAVDATGNVFLAYTTGGITGTVREFNSLGSETNNWTLLPQEEETTSVSVSIVNLAFDQAGQLVIGEQEEFFRNSKSGHRYTGTIYSIEGTSLSFVSDFGRRIAAGFVPDASTGINRETNELYSTIGNEVVTYTPKTIGQNRAGPASCRSGPDNGVNATDSCTLTGTANAWGVSETEAWFQWSLNNGGLSGTTEPQQIAPTENFEMVTPTTISGLRPNSRLDYRMAGTDANIKILKEPIIEHGVHSVSTQPVPPRVTSTPATLAVHATSAVVSSTIDPENTNTRYRFEYAPASECSNLEESSCRVSVTPLLESPAYGVINVIQEAIELQPATTYRYRLIGQNADGEQAVGSTGTGPLPESVFTTTGVPQPSIVVDPAGAISSTSAELSGVVNTDGTAVVYAFELGVYAGNATVYTPVSTGGIGGSGGGATDVRFQLTGLLPGVSYAYRMSVASGYLPNGIVFSQPVVFTTRTILGCVAGFCPPGARQLEVPTISFPTEARPSGKEKGKEFTQELHRCLKLSTRKKRANCRRKVELRHRRAVPKTKKRGRP